MPTHKALIIGDDTRSFLATVRSLGRKGIEVHAAPYSMLAPALQSKYIKQTHLLPYYLNGGADWLQAMQRLMSAQRFDIIIPCEERSLLPLYKHQHELPADTALAIPNPQALDAFFDKINTRHLATQLGVPVAKGRSMLPTDTAESILTDLKLPLVIKQRKSYSWPELYVRTSVKFVEDSAQLDSVLPCLVRDYEDFFFEEIFQGRGLGVSVLCHNGAVLQAFEHHRAHEQGGSSYYRKSAPLNAARLAAVSNMAVAVSYTGLAMFEFKLNEANGDWILLEVNARPWGSLPLPVSVGVDFPHQLFKLLVLKETPGAVAYNAGIYGRNFFPDLWQLRKLFSQSDIGFLPKLFQTSNWIGGFLRPLIGREHHDVFTWDDKWPAWLELKQFLQDRWDPTPLRPESALTRIRLLLKTKSEPIQIAFICQGNICRSPYAEIKAKELFNSCSKQLVFSSAGMLPRSPRGSPANALVTAAAHHISMQNHLSQHATNEFVKNADIIFIFDKKNYYSFQARYPKRISDVFFMTDAVEVEPNLDLIDDPDGLDNHAFTKVYDSIDKQLNNLLAGVKVCLTT